MVFNKVDFPFPFLPINAINPLVFEEILISFTIALLPYPMVKFDMFKVGFRS